MEEKPVKYSCIIIDDEPIAIRVISNYLEKLDEFNLIGGYSNALDALKYLHNNSVDLLFLDIQMPGINGLEFFKSIPNPPEVIFTTAFRNYAADAFDVDALDYLIKPIPFERFLKATNKFIDSRKKIEKQDPNISHINYIILKSDKKNFKVNVDDILYIESLDDYIRVHSKNNKLVCYMRLNAIGELLKDFDFIVRVHRSYMVNTKHISVFTHYCIGIGDKQIPISRSYRDLIVKKLSKTSQ
jgi:DNA-binding LytR/AlgR family response regulator